MIVSKSKPTTRAEREARKRKTPFHRESGTGEGETSEGGTRNRRIHTAEYLAWQNMNARCNRKTHPSYPNYGGRGISICVQWKQYESFLSDMGRRPTLHHSLDRIDVNGNYEPSNCRWATRREQNRNKRITTFIEAKGERRPISEWSEITGISKSGIRKRLDAGMSADEAISRPLSASRSSVHRNSVCPTCGSVATEMVGQRKYCQRDAAGMRNFLAASAEPVSYEQVYQIEVQA